MTCPERCCRSKTANGQVVAIAVVVALDDDDDHHDQTK